jgi:hypothetical protein
MSHFTTLVIGEEPETLLAPFDENTEVEPYRDYLSEDKPADHWLFKILVEEHGLDPEGGWGPFVEAHNKRYGGDGDRLEYDAEKDRAYSMSTYNPKSKWDWHSLGGRWTGYFKLREGANRLVGTVGRPGLMTERAKPGWVDQVRKADIDFEGMRALAEAEAISEHAKVRTVLDGIATPARWEHVREHMFPGDIDAARSFYHNQPGIKALDAADIYVDDPVEYYHLDADDPAAAYIERRVSQAGVPFAILTADGWAEKGRMGWWAFVTDEKADWIDIARSIIDGAPDSALFSLYDLHI